MKKETIFEIIDKLSEGYLTLFSGPINDKDVDKAIKLHNEIDRWIELLTKYDG